MVIKSTDTESCSAIASSGDFVNKSIKDKTRVSLGVFFGGGAELINFGSKMLYSKYKF